VTVTLNLRPEVAADLLAQAEVTGMSVEEYLRSIVERVVMPITSGKMSPDQRAAAFQSWSANHRATPPLSDDAISRESMYEDRDR
jgi:hypothetical protein